MKYSEIKPKIRILHKHGYKKDLWNSYVKVYKLNNWNFSQAISIHDILYSRMDLEDMLEHLYEKNMRLLFEYLLEQEKKRRE
jgi:hypothetical protein